MDGNYKMKAIVMNEEFKGEVEELGAEIRNSTTKGQTVFYGSSSIRLWETLSVDFPELDCLNIAFGGSQIKDCIDYFNELLGKTSPSRVVFYAGDNDLGDGCTVDEVFDRFVNFYGLVDSHFPQVPFTFVSIKPSPSRSHVLSEIQDVNRLIRSFLSGKDNSYYVDVHNPMLSKGEANSDLFIEDMLHMNNSGYAIWKKELREHLDLV